MQEQQQDQTGGQHRLEQRVAHGVERLLVYVDASTTR